MAKTLRPPRLVVKQPPRPQSSLPRALRMKSIRINSAMRLVRAARASATSPVIPPGGAGPDINRMVNQLSKGTKG